MKKTIALMLLVLLFTGFFALTAKASAKTQGGDTGFSINAEIDGGDTGFNPLYWG